MKYELRNRCLDCTYSFSDDSETLRKDIDEHRQEGWRNKHSVIISTKARPIGIKFRLLFGLGHSIIPHWKKYSGLEAFGLFFQISVEYHDFADKIVYDPMNEYPVGADVKKLQLEIKNQKNVVSHE